MGPSIVYSERTNEELEELFRTIVDDEEFINVCHEKINQYEKDHENDYTSYNSSTNKFEYDEIPPTNGDDLKPVVVHEINVSVYYNVEVDKNNSDLTFVKRFINVVPEEENEKSTKKNRFSNLNLSNDIERVVKAHDHVHHSQPEIKPPPQKKSSIKRRQTYNELKRRSTISSVNETQEYDSAVLARIVEQQLEAARLAAEKKKSFNPIITPSVRTEPPVNRATFIQPPILIPKTKEETPRHRIDDIEFPRTNINRLRKPFTFIDNLAPKSSPSKSERDKLLILGQQGLLSSAVALGSSRIPDNIKTIELLEIPNTKTNLNQYQDFHLIGYETLDNHSFSTTPILRRAKSMKNINKQRAPSAKRLSTIVSDITSDNSSKFASPLKSIRRNFHHKNETANYNKQVFKEKSRGKTNRRKSNMGICRRN